MRIIACTLLFSLVANINVFSQRYGTHFAAGYNINIGDYNAINTLLFRYNTSRDWLDVDMEYVNDFQGFVLEGGQMFNKSVLMTSFTQRGFRTYSEGFSNIEDFRRDLRMSMNSFGLAYGYFPITLGVFRPVVGLRLEATRLNMSTRTTGPTGTNLPPFNRLDNYRGDWMMFISPYFELRITPKENSITGLGIRPYLHYGLTQRNNLSTAGTDLIFNLDTENFPERYNDKMPSFGLEIKLVVGLNQSLE